MQEADISLSFKSLLEVLRHKFSRLRRILADQAYAAALVDWLRALRVASAGALGDCPPVQYRQGLYCASETLDC
jgi:hypothetical protein